MNPIEDKQANAELVRKCWLRGGQNTAKSQLFNLSEVAFFVNFKPFLTLDPW